MLWREGAEGAGRRDTGPATTQGLCAGADWPFAACCWASVSATSFAAAATPPAAGIAAGTLEGPHGASRRSPLG